MQHLRGPCGGRSPTLIVSFDERKNRAPRKVLSMSMMENAITSIELGVEDFVNDDPRRLTSAMRNVSSGILLLLKCVLHDRSPAGSDGVLIYQNIIEVTLPNGTIAKRPKGKKTVDVFTIKERFKELGIDFDWSNLDTIVDIRNEIEHFHTVKPEALVREALAAALPLIQTILADLLGETAADAFNEKCWGTLREVREIFDRQLAACRETLGKVGWDSELLADAAQQFKCTNCSSSLVRQIDVENDEVEAIQFECADCKQELEWGEVIEAGLIAAASYDNYVALKDGGEPALVRCFECARDSYSTADGRCLLGCGADDDDLECAVCGTHPSPEDYVSETGMCSYCHWTLQKVLEED